MSTFIIKDEDGNLLDGLYQWDVGIKLNISGISLKDANARVHFVSKDDNEALVVVPTVSNNNTSLTVTIPTILLQKTDPIVAYIYDRVGPNGGKKTKYFIRIPIEPRMKPAGYNYTETADIVYEHINELTQLAELIRTGMASNINTSGSIHADGDISTDGDISAVGLIRTEGDITADGYVEADLDLIAGKDVKAYGGIYQWIDNEWKPIATRQYVDNKTQPATASSLGVIKVGDGLSVENDGTLKVSSDIRDKAGLVTKDGSSAKFSGDVYANTSKKLATEEYVNNHTPNAATNDSLGTVKVGGGLNVANDGTVSVNTNEIATRSYADGKASAAEENAKADAHSYTDTEVAKRASKSAYGTMKVGDGLSVGSGANAGVVSVDTNTIATKGYADNIVADKIAFVEVAQLPTGANIKEKTIYCVPDGEDGHDKFIYIPVQGRAEADCWEQLGGGGGAVILNSAAEKPNVGKDGIDYYIKNVGEDNSVSYVHEIYVSDDNGGGAYYAIKSVGVDEALAEALNAASDAMDAANDAETLAASVASRVTAAETAIAGIADDISDLQDNEETYGTGLAYEGGKLYLTHDRNKLGEGIEVSSGGGGGEQVEPVTFTLTNKTGWFSKTISDQEDCIISASWSSVSDVTEQDTGSAILNVLVNGILRHEAGLDPVADATFSINVAPFLRSGTNTIQVRVTDARDKVRTLKFSINKISISITSSFNPAAVFYGDITFPFTPVGSVEKTVHFILDGTEIEEAGKAPLVTSVSDYQLSYKIPRQAHGAHTFECYCTAIVNNVPIESNHLYYEFISLTANTTTAVIASSFHESTVAQHTTINIDFLVYDPASNLADVDVYTNINNAGSVKHSEFKNVDRSIHTFTYRCSNVGSLAITFVSGGVSKTVSLTVTASDVNSIAATDQLKLFLISAGRSNNEGLSSDNGATGRNSWTFSGDDGDIKAQFSNFDYRSDGWQLDKDGISVLRVKGDARLTIPYRPFAADFKSTGKTIELEFATHEVFDLDATILSCISGGRGIVVTPEKATIKSANDELSTQFKEDEHVRISFVVGKDTAGDEQRRLVLIYINGIASGVIQYGGSDNFAQESPEYITIGSNDCTIDMYCIRVYDVALTRKQILNNWIADTQDGALMLERWNRNQIFDDHGDISSSKLPDDLPYMIIHSHELPPEKGIKKTAEEVEFVNKLDATKSFIAEGVELDVQGTSSKDYARKNYDMKFKHGFQIGASHRQSDMYALSDDCLPFNRFVIKADVASSESANNTGLTCFYNDTTPYKTAEQIANPKVRQGIYGFPIAVFWENTDPESENAGEVIFLGKYNFNLPKRASYPYGYAGILDDEIVLYDENGELLDEDDPNYNHKKMESWEWENNDSDLLKFKTDVFDDELVLNVEANEYRQKWRDDFEARFPDDSHTDIDKLQELVSFVYSTYRAEATNSALSSPITYRFDSADHLISYKNDDSYSVSEVTISGANGTSQKKYDVTFTKDTPAYRLSKFKAGIGEIMEVDSAIFYYIFTELFLMVDSRCKNMFVGFKGGHVDSNNCVVTGATHITRKAVLEPYDMDTALGTDNSGELKYGFSYGLEDTDTVDDAIIYNGQDSVLWCNIRDAFVNEIGSMYDNLRSNSNFSYEAVENMFEQHQAKWPEAMWNEDAMFKYIWPLTKPDAGRQSEDRYLKMMLGSKAEQRKWWLYNRFRYMDSKWHAGDALGDQIVFRARERGNITITPFKDMYATINFGGRLKRERVKAGNPVTLINDASFTAGTGGRNEQIINIHSASEITNIGNLSGLKVFGFTNLNNAVNLRQLIVGSGDPGFSNEELTSLNISNNVMLMKLDARNCTALTRVDGLSRCENIREVLLENTSVTSVVTPDGGKLNKLHLPATVSTLEIRNQPNLSDFSIAGNGNLQALSIYGEHTFNSKSIVTGATNLVSVHLENVDWTGSNALNNADPLLAIAGIDPDTFTFYKGVNYSFYLSGTIDVNKWTADERSAIESAFAQNGNPTINWIGTAVASHTVKFINYDDTELCRQTIRHGDSAVNPINNVIPTRRISVPVKPEEIDKNYTFSRWVKWDENNSTASERSLENITEDITFKAVFDTNTRRYTVEFRHSDGTTVIETHSVYAGETAKYEGSDLDPVLDGGYNISDKAVWVGFELKTPYGSEVDTSGNKLSTQAVYSDIIATALYLKPSSLSETGITRPTGAFIYSDDPKDGGLSLRDFYSVLCSSSYDGYKHDQFLRLGDKVKIVLDDNNVLSARDKEIIMIVVGFECYELDGTNEQTDPDERYARVVFQMQGTLNALVPMAGGPTPDGWGVLGWGDSDASNSPTIRTRLNFGYTSGTTDIPSIYSLLPVHWRNMIKPVKIKYLVGMGYLDVSPSLKTCVDKLFLPSFVELGGIGSLTAQQQTHFVKEVGSRYGITDTEQHILQYYLPISGNGSAKLSKGPNNANADPYYADVPKSDWWTRSPVYTGQTVFQCIGSGGGVRYGYSTWSAKSASARISFAFCI